MKTVEFKYTKKDGTIDLGVPENVSTNRGNFRDGGCELKFETSCFSVGITEKFSLYLFAGDINRVTKEIWDGYVKTEPVRAKNDIDKLIEYLKEIREK